MLSERPDSRIAARPQEDAPSAPLRVGIVLLHQFTLTAFAGFLDVLRLASDYGGNSRQILIRWRVMSVDGAPRRSSAGTLQVELTDLGDVGDFDYIAVCGGNSYTNTTPSKKLSAWLVQAYKHKVILLGLCTGTFAIAQAGIVGNRAVCVHWNVIEEFQRQFPTIKCNVDNLFVDAGALVTCAGSTAAIDLALYLLTRHYGKEKAQQALRHMMLHSIRPARLPQAHFYIDLDQVSDLRVHKAVHFIEQRIDDFPSVSSIAAHVGVSPRQLERIFKAALNTTPAALHRVMRLQYGKWLVTNTRDSITEIALSCGFSDSSHFAREFKLLFGETPRTFRGG
ncbi:GlxA family transcriptional regulator [Pollutimonas bauzanensis]|uniref:Transcriptional regulator GlxA family, contains an amidase domain and an AraC-type DNA-binding HTH domain n=1 Tax=Pollutimonas bauzanensis TaxID=658167 RepID=A0A1M5ZXK3_9BURK|nr:GlxA family transcriptional regulator [Pollutimonas bauzanensis]SHI28952.1 Transcriptional regulator GlxA family, contains an amidase domain and an AraC-type DNA-binding HTH domain [Pollutimonas bauzanensis]